ncbi:MAG TPA: putative quinol monooxygenase [Burkholderiaceae bacterium]|nr:putative quinol monooxygenase [Burkholderiaceae bacterium]
MILVVGSVAVQEGQLAEALALSQAHVARSRSEPGCLLHGVHQDTENPNHLVFIEKWADQESLRKHFNVPDSRAFAKALSRLAVEAPALEVYDGAPVRV